MRFWRRPRSPLRHVRVLRLQPGDVLVASFDRPVSMAERDRIRRDFEGAFGVSRRVLVIDGRLEVVRRRDVDHDTPRAEIPSDAAPPG